MLQRNEAVVAAAGTSIEHHYNKTDNSSNAMSGHSVVVYQKLRIKNTTANSFKLTIKSRIYSCYMLLCNMYNGKFVVQ